ncbi:hypothetical protein NVP1031O_118 [Vibrio phage 1.031.O._10N.261.46.F8]|nr:hypothetical protein NVP1031O_118 [Vibrio phage 1.031.O._10N.261.46.F8]
MNMKFEDAVRKMREGKSVKPVNTQTWCLNLHNGTIFKCRLVGTPAASKVLLDSTEIMGDWEECTDRYMDFIESPADFPATEVPMTELPKRHARSILGRISPALDEVLEQYREAFKPNFHIVS